MQTEWKDYLSEFEKEVLMNLFRSEDYQAKLEPVPIRPGKLLKTPFGDFIGQTFQESAPVSFNYYGLFKLSSGISSINPKGRNTIQAPVIHFSSVKIEHIEQFSKPLIVDFVSFKKFMVNLRWKGGGAI